MIDPMTNQPVISRQEWLQQVQKDLKGADFNEKLVHNRQNIDVQPIYTAEDLPAFSADPNADFLEDLDPELIEAVRDSGAQHLTWSIVEDCLFDAGTDLNLAVAHTRNRGVVDMRIRVRAESDWDHILNEIRKISSPVNFHFDLTGPMEEFMVDHWRERIGYLGDRDRLVQALEFDPISHWATQGTPENSGTQFNHLAQAFLRFSGYLQDCRLVKVDVRDIAAAQGTAADQLAMCLHRTAQYFDALEARDVPPEELMQLLTFRFGVGTNYFFEIAKLRAWRILWQNFIQVVIPDTDFIPNPYIHVDIATHTFTTEDKYANLLRLTTGAMSAILGGADAISLPAFDTQVVDDHHLRLSANVHNLLRYESNLDRNRDAAHGSYYIESLTQSIGQQAWQLFTNMQNK